jgi:hypothetical protein
LVCVDGKKLLYLSMQSGKNVFELNKLNFLSNVPIKIKS